MNVPDYPKLEISRPNLQYNIDHFRSLLKPSTKLLVLLKANAYGAGAVEIGKLVKRMGVDYVAVAFVNEGVELRMAGINLPLMLLTWTREAVEQIVEYDMEPGVTDIRSLVKLHDYLYVNNIHDYPVHIKIDTGMHRVGFMEDEIPELMEYLKRDDFIRVKSIYSHLAGADEECFDEFTISQAKLFDRLSLRIADTLGYMPMRHLLNTAGIERFAERYPEYQYDMVRMGIGTYGIETIPGEDVRPVVSLKTEVIQVKRLSQEEGTVGYSRRGTISRPSEIAAIPLGYADGIDRRLGNGAASFMVKGKLAPTIGNICMDELMLDVTGLGVKAGDEVTVFGENPRLEELSAILGTIPYEVLVGISRRVNRVVVK